MITSLVTIPYTSTLAYFNGNLDRTGMSTYLVVEILTTVKTVRIAIQFSGYV